MCCWNLIHHQRSGFFLKDYQRVVSKFIKSLRSRFSWVPFWLWSCPYFPSTFPASPKLLGLPIFLQDCVPASLLWCRSFCSSLRPHPCHPRLRTVFGFFTLFWTTFPKGTLAACWPPLPQVSNYLFADLSLFKDLVLSELANCCLHSSNTVTWRKQKNQSPTHHPSCHQYLFMMWT